MRARVSSNITSTTLMIIATHLAIIKVPIARIIVPITSRIEVKRVEGVGSFIMSLGFINVDSISNDSMPLLVES